MSNAAAENDVSGRAIIKHKHGIGTIAHPEELTGPGSAHEEAGRLLLVQCGFPDVHARFARTYGRWRDDPGATLEDLLVALADMIWKGKRDQHLEDAIAHRVARLTGDEPWATCAALDDILQPLAQGADARLSWQAAPHL